MTQLKQQSTNTIQGNIYLAESQEAALALNLELSTERLKGLLENNTKRAIHVTESQVNIIQILESKTKDVDRLELARRKAAEIVEVCDNYNLSTIELHSNAKSLAMAFAEGLMLMNYQFLKYKSDAAKIKHKLQEIVFKPLNNSDLIDFNARIHGTLLARDLVNEPLSCLTALEISKRAQEIETDDLTVKVYNKTEIEELKMGGLLAVNKGSIDPPTFTVLEWKPENIKNKKPLALIGKGIVYDTGGLSLKPTPNSMDLMKSDMGGAATVIGTMLSLAKAKVPYWVKAYVPATDNRPGQNAYVPGDVITMYDKTSVEVLNTDAEGRMVLADALSFAKQDKPELGISVATLTGAAAYSIGKYACVAMGNAKEDSWKSLESASNTSGERFVRFPFWSDYFEQMKSDVADLKNIGGSEGGAITAGKFLEHFTDYPYMHFDIAGPAFVTDNYLYNPKGGTGYGVRLLSDFVKKLANV